MRIYNINKYYKEMIRRYCNQNRVPSSIITQGIYTICSNISIYAEIISKALDKVGSPEKNFSNVEAQLNYILDETLDYIRCRSQSKENAKSQTHIKMLNSMITLRQIFEKDPAWLGIASDTEELTQSMAAMDVSEDGSEREIARTIQQLSLSGIEVDIDEALELFKNILVEHIQEVLADLRKAQAEYELAQRQAVTAMDANSDQADRFESNEHAMEQ